MQIYPNCCVKDYGRGGAVMGLAYLESPGSKSITSSERNGEMKRQKHEKFRFSNNNIYTYERHWGNKSRCFFLITAEKTEAAVL